MTTIQNSAAERTTAASHSGLCVTVSMIAGTTAMSKAVVGGAAGVWGRGKSPEASGALWVRRVPFPCPCSSNYL